MAIGDRKNVVMEADIGTTVPPKTHADQHAATGSDPITPESIRALPTTGGRIDGNLAITGRLYCAYDSAAYPVEIGKYLDFHDTYASDEDYVCRLTANADNNSLYLGTKNGNHPLLTGGNYYNYALPLTGGTMTGTLYSNCGVYIQGNSADVGSFVQHIIDSAHNAFTRNYYYDSSVIVDLGTNLATRTLFLNAYYDYAWHFNTILHSGNFAQFITPSSIGGAQVFFGSYEGTGSATSQTITLGFQPKAVILASHRGLFGMLGGYGCYGGIFAPGYDLIWDYKVAATVTSTGFTVSSYSGGSCVNETGTYYYIVFK